LLQINLNTVKLLLADDENLTTEQTRNRHSCLFQNNSGASYDNNHTNGDTRMNLAHMIVLVCNNRIDAWPQKTPCLSGCPS
jgi:hypothetical protein